MPTRPSVYLNWTDGAPNKVTQPTAVQSLSGWTAGEAPPFQYANWLEWMTDLWIQYLDQSVTALNAVATQLTIFQGAPTSGNVDGVNAQFQVPNVVTSAANVVVTLDGEVIDSSQWSLSQSGGFSYVTFNTPPAIAQKVYFFGWTGGTGGVLTAEKANHTISGTDVTNQYFDLTDVVIAKTMNLSVSGVTQIEGVDYTLNLTGGAGGKTRVLFAGDLATGGAAALVATDVVNMQYWHL